MNTRLLRIGTAVLLVSGCSDEDAPEVDAGVCPVGETCADGGCESADPCVASQPVAGGCATWFTAAACDAGVCVLGACTCVTDCGDGRVELVQSIRQRERGFDGLRGARSLAFSPDGKHLYVAAQKDGEVSVLALSDAGLAPVDRVPLADATAVAVSADGATVAAGTDGGEITLYARDLESGVLATQQTVSGPFGGLRDLAFTTGAQLLVAASSPGTVGVVSAEGGQWGVRDQVTGSFEGACVIRLDADGQGAWIGAHSGTVTRLTPSNTGGWLQGAGSTSKSMRPELENLHDLIVSADGKHMYVAGESGLWSYEIGPQGLEPGAPSAMVLPHNLTLGWDDSDVVGVDAIALLQGGTKLAGAVIFGAYVIVWDRDPATGDLTNPTAASFQPGYTDDHFEEDTGGKAIGIDPLDDIRLVSMTLNPAGERLVLASGQWDFVAALNAGDGAKVSTLQAGDGGITNLGGAYSVTVSPDDAHIYVAAWNIGDPAGFKRDEAGRLTPLPDPAGSPQRPADYGLSDLVVTADGAQVLAVDDQYNQVHAYDRDAASGALTYRHSTGDQAQHDIQVAVAVPPDGRHVYTGAFESSTLARIQRDAVGDLSYMDVITEPQLTGLEDIIFANDEHAYVAAFGPASAGVSLYRRGAEGELAFEEQVSTDLTNVEAIALSADGKRIVAVCPPTDRIVVLNRAADGAISHAATSDWKTDGEWGPTGPGVGPSPGRVAVVDAPKTGELDLYISYRLYDQVAHWRVDAAEKPALTFMQSITPPPSAAGDTEPTVFPNGVAASKDGCNVYVATTLGDGVLTFVRKSSAEGEENGCGGKCAAAAQGE